MRYGMNLLMWTDSLSEEILPVLEQLKQIGYDAVEIPVFEADVEHYRKWGQRLDEAGLSRTGTVVRGPGDNPMSPDPTVRRKGVEANKTALDCCAAAGCEVMAGPFYTALGEFSGKGPTRDEWQWAVESIQEVAEHAQEVEVTLALEYLNRFECYLLNTAADAARFCRDVSHPYCKTMYDTFHAHIEEKSVAGAIRTLADSLVHVHVSENDRSTPGQGSVRWEETFDTLREIGYDNLLVVEAFGLVLDRLIPATKIWRRMYQSETQLVSDALGFMKAQVAKRW
jgi:D-psicose/D-tagatose/L-ribulose 3-epimerase